MVDDGSGRRRQEIQARRNRPARPTDITAHGLTNSRYLNPVPSHQRFKYANCTLSRTLTSPLLCKRTKVTR